MRHAKSSWEDSSLSDHDRPLNDRGHRDGPRMANWLHAQGLLPDVILSSTAKRAITTAGYVQSHLEFSGELFEDKRLYHGAPDDYFGRLRQLDESVQAAMVVGHNPGLEELVSDVAGRWERFPTATIAQIRLEIESWPMISGPFNADLLAIWRPKEISFEAE